MGQAAAFGGIEEEETASGEAGTSSKFHELTPEHLRAVKYNVRPKSAIPKVRRLIATVFILVGTSWFLWYFFSRSIYISRSADSPWIFWNDHEAYVAVPRITRFDAPRPAAELAQAPLGFFKPSVPSDQIRKDLYLAHLTTTGVESVHRFRDFDYGPPRILSGTLSFSASYRTEASKDSWRPSKWTGSRLEPWSEAEAAEILQRFGSEYTPASYWGWNEICYDRWRFPNLQDNDTTAIMVGNVEYKLRFERKWRHISIFANVKASDFTIFISGTTLPSEQVLLSIPADVHKVGTRELLSEAGAVSRDLPDYEEQKLGVRFPNRSRFLEWQPKPVQEF